MAYDVWSKQQDFHLRLRDTNPGVLIVTPCRQKLVDPGGLEPPHLLLARQVPSQFGYRPMAPGEGIEPPASELTARRPYQHEHSWNIVRGPFRSPTRSRAGNFVFSCQ